MKTHTSIAIAALTASLLTGVHAYAADTQTEETTSGILGRAYWQTDLGTSRISGDDVSASSYGIGFGVNLPLVKDHFDLMLSDALGKSSEDDIYANSLLLQGRLYTQLGGVRPCALVGAGALSVFGGDVADTEGVWTVGAGVEIPLGSFSIIPMIHQDRSFSSGSGSSTVYELDVNYWFSKSTAVHGGVIYNTQDGRKTTGVALGMRFSR